MGNILDFLSFWDRVEDLNSSHSSTLSWSVAHRDGKSLRLRIHSETHLDEIPDQTWEIRVDEIREVSLNEGQNSVWSFHDDLTFSHDHVLLWGFKDLVSQLNFSGPPESHEGLLWDLHDRHAEVTGGWIPFERYFSSYFRWNRLSGGHGVLANGPNRLLQEYASVLKQSDLVPYFPYPPHPPVRDYSEQGVSELLWKDEDQNLAVLVLFDSFVVDSGFSAEPVNGA